MVRLEDLAPGILVKGILPESAVAITGLRWHGVAGVELNFADTQGYNDQVLLCREHEYGLEIIGNQREWSFEADAHLWRLAAAARSMQLAAEAHRGATYLYGVRLLAHLRKAGEEGLASAVHAKIADPQFLAMASADPVGADLEHFFDAGLTALGGRGTRLCAGRFEIVALPEVLGNPSTLPQIIDFNASADPDVESLDPGHVLVRALTENVLTEFSTLLRRGSALVIPGAGAARVCLLVEQAIGQTGADAEEPWRQLQLVEVDAEGHARSSLEPSWWDLRPPSSDEQLQIDAWRQEDWLATDFEESALACVVSETVHLHLESARRGREYVTRRIAEELGGESRPMANGNGFGHAAAIPEGVDERLRPILESWSQKPLLPLLPKVVGGVLLVPEELLMTGVSDRRTTATVVEVPDFEPALRAATPQAASDWERSEAFAEEELPEEPFVEEERPAEGFFAQIPGLLAGPEMRKPPRTSLGATTLAGPPILTQSKAWRVPVDLQREWQAHAERLLVSGVEAPAGVELVRRNPVDGGIGLWIPPGSFTMGDRRGDRDERPMHQVHLEAFYMDLQPVTQTQYQHFVRETGYRNREWEPLADAADHPVIRVSWEDAVAYCTWAQKRLPTEAEWEKAARGTDGRTFPWGDTFERGRASVLGRGFSGTSPVGTLPAGASPYGGLDMSGNVWEWVADYYAPDYYASGPPHNPMGPDKGRQRVMRGGAWICHRRYLRCAKRERQAPDYRSRLVGFRCAL